eukprot:COSAG06_NODE_4619_length_4093_cov_55.188216_3_plen_151_part_00
MLSLCLPRACLGKKIVFIYKWLKIDCHIQTIDLPRQARNHYRQGLKEEMRFSSCLVLSCLVLSCLVLSCLVLSCSAGEIRRRRRWERDEASQDNSGEKQTKQRNNETNKQTNKQTNERNESKRNETKRNETNKQTNTQTNKQTNKQTNPR